MQMPVQPDDVTLRGEQAAAAILNCSVWKLRQLVAGGHLAVVKLPGSPRRRFRLEALERLARESESTAEGGSR